MPKSIRFTSTVSLIVLASMVAACAAPQGRLASASAGKAKGEAGLALRALAALNSNDTATAISLTERAVEQTPDDASLRALLGNAYFLAGRFASAETAFKDALALDTNQPRILLKLALVEIAQGKSSEALAFLDAGRNMLPAADYGLALALAGRPADAIEQLQAAARVPGADARVRQNLALAYALGGDWAQARIVAGQDVPADQLDARIQQWMRISTPVHPADQVAALTGVTPAISDAGQPVRLALRAPDTRLAAAVPPAAPAQVAEAAPQPEFVPVAAPVEFQPDPASVAVEAAPPPPPPPTPPPPAVSVTQAAAIAPEAPAVFAAIAPNLPALKVRRASAPVARPAARNTALRKGNSTAVVQIGAYGSTQRVTTAWNAAARRYAMLRSYTPMSARFESRVGTVYRLSVKGFASVGEANSLCASLRRTGASCFVRNVAGDAPVQFASR